ncbi:GNAT family N-acetyltransferase [Chitinophagaceae bacterium MMS25-I14]
MVSILIDDELQLRTYLPEDAAELFHVVNQSRQHLRTFLTWVDTTTKPEHTTSFIQQSLTDQNDQRALALGIFHNRKIVGGIGLHNWNHYLKKVEIGYWIAKDFEGQGIITRATERFIDFIFDKLGMNKVEIHFMPHNKHSAAVAERLGARVEGVIRESHMFNGKLEDIVITGILKTEWQQRKK